uniref:hypothetical protein n=1 Tax=Segatella hominis TaxID=2518605 RepID=UPI004026A89A
PPPGLVHAPDLLGHLYHLLAPDHQLAQAREQVVLAQAREQVVLAQAQVVLVLAQAVQVQAVQVLVQVVQKFISLM